MITLKQINKALKEEGINACLLKGYGYFYFVGEDMDEVKEQGVYGVYNLNSYSIEEWVEIAKDKIRMVHK